MWFCLLILDLTTSYILNNFFYLYIYEIHILSKLFYWTYGFTIHALYIIVHFWLCLLLSLLSYRYCVSYWVTKLTLLLFLFFKSLCWPSFYTSSSTLVVHWFGEPFLLDQGQIFCNGTQCFEILNAPYVTGRGQPLVILFCAIEWCNEVGLMYLVYITLLIYAYAYVLPFVDNYGLKCWSYECKVYVVMNLERMCWLCCSLSCLQAV